jgi:hypothetical protein
VPDPGNLVRAFLFAWLPALGGLCGLLALCVALGIARRQRQLGRLQEAGVAGASAAELLSRLAHLEQALAELRAENEQRLLPPGLERFRALDGDGAWSFSLALLNRRGDGVVLTTLQARDQVRLFAKRLQGGVPEVALSAEEVAAAREAGLAAPRSPRPVRPRGGAQR